MTNKLSILICTKNEEEMIADCLELAIWADEVIIIDDYSSDETIKIAEKYPVKIFQNHWKGFADQKNFGFKKTVGEWVLFLDADERITPQLKETILREINNSANNCTAYNIQRLNNLLGKDMYHGGWYPDYQKRLVMRSKFIKWRGKLHEMPFSYGQTGIIKAYIYHITHRQISWMVEKSLKYTKLEAEERLKLKHPKIVWWRFFRPMFQEFFYRLITKSGWRDGIVGWIEVIYQSFNSFLIYARLWEMQLKETKKV